MKKNKRFIKMRILLLGLLLFLINCQKENELILNEILQIEQEIKLENISLIELRQNKELNQALNIIDSRLDVNQNKSNLSSKGKIKTSDFTILTDEIIKITKNSTISYTFKIKKSKSDYFRFKNFMINKYSDDSYQFYLFEYARNEEEGQSFSYGVSYKLLDKNLINISDFDNLLRNKLDIELPFCADVSYTECSAGGNADGHGPALQSNGSYCSGSTTIIDFSNCPAGGGGGETTTNDTDDGGVNDNNNDTEGGTIITSPIANSDSSIIISEYQNFWMSLSTSQQKFLGSNPTIKDNMLYFLIQNQYNHHAQNFAIKAIDIFSTPKITSSSYIDYKFEVLRMTNHLRQWGDPEDEFLADYIESLIPDFISMSFGEVHDIYSLTRTQVHELTKKYLLSVVIPFAEAAYPFVVYAVIDASLGAAIPLLSRIPLSMVLRGARLNKMVKNIGSLGVRSTTNYNIRVITTSSPVRKAEELFVTLTKNALSKTTQTNGIIVADMGNGNFITYRPLSGSSSGFEATIELKFREIWSKNRILKFTE